jgi:hypothetical protein
MRRIMAGRNAKFDLEALMRSAEKAKREIAQWPMWKQQVAAASFVSRPNWDDDDTTNATDTASSKPPPLTERTAD